MFQQTQPGGQARTHITLMAQTSEERATGTRQQRALCEIIYGLEATPFSRNRDRSFSNCRQKRRLFLLCLFPEESTEDVLQQTLNAANLSIFTTCCVDYVFSSYCRDQSIERHYFRYMYFESCRYQKVGAVTDAAIEHAEEYQPAAKC